MTVPTVIWVLHDSADESMFLHEVEWYREEFYLRLYSRKVAEVLAAGRIEDLYDKEKIFELYVNTIYFGSGYYSVYDASMGYFGKKPSEMNDYECTMLAGIPNAPSVYSPDVNPTLAEERRQQVLECMAEAGYIQPGDIE